MNSDGSMSLFVSTILLGSIALAGNARSAGGADKGDFWPSWRGPEGNGTSSSADPPLVWSELENIRWKIEVPGRGLASPIVWQDAIYLLTSVAVDARAYAASQRLAAEKQENEQWPPDVAPTSQRFMVQALDRHDGRLLWEHTVAEVEPHESHYIDNSWASGSPVTDGEVLIAHFGSMGTFAFDLEGNELWHSDLGDMTTRRGFGEGSSPSIHGDKVVINWDHEGDSFLVALDRSSGREVWKTPRPNEVTSWSTPLIVGSSAGNQIVVPATGMSRGYALDTGREIWSLPGMTVNTIPSPVHRNGVVYLASGYRGNILQAVDLDKARGDVDGTEALLWSHTEHTPYVPSVLLYDDQLYFIKHFRNILTSLNADTGEVLFTETRMEGISNVWSSPVGAAGRVYIVSREGRAIVLEHGPEYRVLAENSLDERFDATPALVDGEIYLRGHRYLYCISKQRE